MSALDELAHSRDTDEEEAEKWRKIVGERPNDAHAYAEFAKASARIGDFDAAAEAANHALQLDATLSLPYFVLGSIHAENQRFAEAEFWFQKALLLDPYSAAIHHQLGKVHFQQQEYSEAVNHLEQAVALAPQVSDLHANLASTYLRIGRFGDAARESFTILRRNPLDGSAYRILGWLPFAAFAQSKMPIRIVLVLVLF
ncbi:MAG: tetratricopeptide repeat protein, partial [Anaerolineae bacterium]